MQFVMDRTCCPHGQPTSRTKCLAEDGQEQLYDRHALACLGGEQVFGSIGIGAGSHWRGET